MKKHIKKFYTFINENTSNLILYHGGPFKFNTFSMEHVGNGEGFHQFGWGMYFSDDIKLAKRYRDKAYNKYELDFYIPSKKIGIEVNGNYWHSEVGGKRNKKYQ